MAQVVLTPDPQRFPPGTAVKVFAQKRPATPLVSGKPPGSQLSEPSVATNGSLTVTGLTAGEAYVGWVSPGGVDVYLLFEVEPATVGGGGGLTQAEVETLLGTTGISHLLLEGGGVELLKLRSTSTTAHAASIVQAGTSGGSASALNVASSNPASSALQVTGVEEGRGSIKVSHTNPTATATGDENAAALSLELHGNVAEKKTAAQGIFLTANETDASGGSTGAWLSIKHPILKAIILRITAAGGLLLKKNSTAIASPESGDVVIQNEEGHVYAVNNAGEKAQLDVAPTSAWKPITPLAKCTGAVAGFLAAEGRTEDKGGTARLRGALKQTAEWKAGEPIFTLPAAMRPPAGVKIYLATDALVIGATEAETTIATVELVLIQNGEVQIAASGVFASTGRILMLDNLTWSLT